MGSTIMRKAKQIAAYSVIDFSFLLLSVVILILVLLNDWPQVIDLLLRGAR